jgi:hypothetical protein
MLKYRQKAQANYNYDVKLFILTNMSINNYKILNIIDF